MSAIWHKGEAGWMLLAPAGFPDEKTLHGLVEEASQLLPLAGSPRLTIVGREVPIGPGYADLIAIEPNGRIAIIEVKLAKNAEARRAIVAQVLAYAAYLRGLSPETVEQEILGPELRRRNLESLADAVRAGDQEGAFDLPVFTEGLAECLRQGRFRLVLVLDSAPEELVRLVSYLQTISDRLLIDLVTVSSYSVNGSTVLVPQRIDPERRVPDGAASSRRSTTAVASGEGEELFVAGIDQATKEDRRILRHLVAWAKQLDSEGIATLASTKGKSQSALVLRVPADKASLVTIWNAGRPSISLWRGVFERRAPQTMQRIEQIIAPKTIGQGNVVTRFDDEFLSVLTDAYREAARPRRIP